MCFRLVSKSVTLNDLERRNGRYFYVISANSGSFRGALRKSSRLLSHHLMSSCYFTLKNENIFLRWPWTLTYNKDVGTWCRQCRGEPASQIYRPRSKVISFDIYCENSYKKKTDCSNWNTQWSVIMITACMVVQATSCCKSRQSK